MVNLRPTPFQDVNEILEILLASVKGVLGENLTGMYLYGSLASGDFDPKASDIDFLVVTNEAVSEATISALDEIHQRIGNAGRKWAEKLEGSYIPKSHLRRYEKTAFAYPTVNEGRFYTAPHGSDWIIQRHIIREQGIVLAGPDPKMLIDPVNPDDFRGAVIGILGEWWFPMLDDPSWLKDRGSPYHAYAILTMCRSLYALEYGTVVSKPAAAAWAQTRLGGKWPQVIERSVAVWKGAKDFDLYREALEMIRTTRASLKATEIRS